MRDHDDPYKWLLSALNDLVTETSSSSSRIRLCGYCKDAILQHHYGKALFYRALFYFLSEFFIVTFELEDFDLSLNRKDGYGLSFPL